MVCLGRVSLGLLQEQGEIRTVSSILSVGILFNTAVIVLLSSEDTAASTVKEWSIARRNRIRNICVRVSLLNLPSRLDSNMPEGIDDLPACTILK